ncbi:MAG: DUF1934 domain-containing protein [Vagococcus sp.]
MKERKATPVLIQVQTKVHQNNEELDYLVEVEGQTVKIGDVLYIRYEEMMEGIDTPVPVTIKLMPDGVVQLIRSGEVRMKLMFEYQKKLETSYNTPYGMMTIATYTKDSDIRLKDNPFSGHVKIEYDLYGGEEKLGNYQLNVNFTV